MTKIVSAKIVSQNPVNSVKASTRATDPNNMNIPVKSVIMKPSRALTRESLVADTRVLPGVIVILASRIAVTVVHDVAWLRVAGESVTTETSSATAGVAAGTIVILTLSVGSTVVDYVTLEVT